MWCVLCLYAIEITAAEAQVEGRVYDRVSGEAVPGAIVSVRASALEVVAGAGGRYSLGEATGPDLTIVAAREGYYYGSVTVSAPALAADIALDRVAAIDDPSYEFQAPDSCQRCHERQYSEWSVSAMAHAGLNEWVADLFDGSGTEHGDGGFVYVRDSVLAPGSPSSECAACHQPEDWIASPGVPLGDLTRPTPGMIRGISCDLCHKVAEIDAAHMNYPGVVPELVRFTRPAPGAEQVQYGVLGDVTVHEPGEMRAAYQPDLPSELCGACHQDKNDPDLDGDFEEENGVVSEPTYAEWAESEYADRTSGRFASCADCHMPPNHERDACTVHEVSIERPDGDVRSHSFEGTTAEYLENAVTLSLHASVGGSRLEVEVAVANDATGHHVPTGVTTRNVILLVEAWRESDSLGLAQAGGETLHELAGVGDPSAGYFAGLAGKLYAKVNYDGEGRSPTFFTDAAGIVFDTRIPALATDTTRYTFAVPDGGGRLRVRARLVYRRAWRALVDAKRWQYDGHGRPLEDIAPPHFGHLMESAEVVVDAPVCDPCDAGLDASRGADAGVRAAPDGCGCATGDAGLHLPWLLIALLRRRRLVGAQRRARRA